MSLTRSMSGPDEMVVRFGDAESLVGIVTLPSAPTNSTAVVLLNAGVIHRVGPHRMNVQLARRLAARGFTALRFDRCAPVRSSKTRSRTSRITCRPATLRTTSHCRPLSDAASQRLRE